MTPYSTPLLSLLSLPAATGFVVPTRHNYATLSSSTRQPSFSRLQQSTTQASIEAPWKSTNAETETQDESIDWTKYWYPIMPLNYLDDDDDMATQAIPMTILDQKLVIWRSESTADEKGNKYSVMADVCPHRRAPLSSGKIIPQNSTSEDSTTTSATLACRYHGWQFDASGSCTKIPMMETSQSTSSKAFCATSYPTQQRDGLLWVYMDPTDPHPPALPAPVLNDIQDETQQYSYSLNVFPVSFQSMIENSFDPSHAPFTHESLSPYKKSFMTYLSQNAIPMEQYELAKDCNGKELFDKDGFTVQHTPYQKSDSPNEITTRQFIAPYTNVAQLPWFNTTLHFVPSKAGETLVYGGGLGGGFPTAFPKNKLLKKILPQKIQTVAQEFIHFYFTNLADFAYRFYNQDVQIMHGQDQRKASNNNKKWNDLYPANSDRGVQFFQKWMNRFSPNKPSFIQPSPSSNSLDGINVIPSAWDRHAKYCPKCKRTIRRLSKASTVTNQLSRGSLMASLATFMAHGVAIAISKFHPHRYSQQPFLLLPWTLLFLISSFSAKLVSNKLMGMVEKVFVSPSHAPSYQMMDIYSR